MLIKDLEKNSKNKTSLPSLTPSTAHAVDVRFFFFSPYSRWIVWFQFKLLVSISQLCTTLSNLFLLGISIWNEALLSLIYLKQTSVPTWWFNRNWLSSKKWAASSGKMHGTQTVDRTKTLSRDANDILLFETAALQSQTLIIFTDFSWITLCWCGIFFHAFPGDHSSHAIYLAPGNLEKYHRHISLQSLYSCLAANWFSKEADRYCHYYVIFKILWDKRAYFSGIKTAGFSGYQLWKAFTEEVIINIAFTSKRKKKEIYAHF